MGEEKRNPEFINNPPLFLKGEALLDEEDDDDDPLLGEDEEDDDEDDIVDFSFVVVVVSWMGRNTEIKQRSNTTKQRKYALPRLAFGCHAACLLLQQDTPQKKQTKQKKKKKKVINVIQ